MNRDHSRRVVERLQAMGVKAAHVDGEDHAARRDRVMAEFRDGAIQVVGNCDLISEGFDAPGCSVIMLGSPTRSITRYLQQAGRAMRPGPDKRALILDLSGISHELGLPDEPREWTLEDGEVSARRKATAKPRECPQCHTMFYGRQAARSVPTSPRSPRWRKRGRTWWRPRGAPRRTASAPTDAPRYGGSLRWLGANRTCAQRSRPSPRRRGYKIGWASHILRAWGM